MKEYNWNLKDAIFTKDKGSVFSCFACGGGSTMGYKLAGFDVIGCNEIDPRMMKVYKANHNPKHSYLEPIQTFKDREDLPEELYNLDILDGSPPCSTFSMSGARERDWGVEKHFREGQQKQVLDTLFFDFIDLAAKLKPKVVIAENVKGMLFGDAIKYVRRIYEEFDKAGYFCQHFLLDAQTMGVPQRRERVFFICLRKDLAAPVLSQADLFEQKPILKLEFNDPPIPFGDFADFEGDQVKSPVMRNLWENRRLGDNDQSDANERLFGKAGGFNQYYIYLDKVSATLPSKKTGLIHFHKPRFLSNAEVFNLSSFPQDYDLQGQQAHYICGMSVPPLMIKRISEEIYKQWLTKI
jgi:DNA (cytosine-5)-methyltransferase 1